MEELNELLLHTESLLFEDEQAVMDTLREPAFVKGVRLLESYLGFTIYYLSHNNEPALTVKGEIFFQVFSATSKTKRPGFLSSLFGEKRNLEK